MLRDVVGFDKIKEKVVNPLKGRKIGAYYGCMLLRPSTTMQFDDPENPTIIEDFIKALGATPVVYPMRNECCYISLKEKKMASNMVDQIMASASYKGAEELITACPLCMYNLRNNGTKEGLPVTYFTELLAEALGIKEEVQEMPLLLRMCRALSKRRKTCQTDRGSSSFRDPSERRELSFSG